MGLRTRALISSDLQEGTALYVAVRSFLLSPLNVATAANYQAKSLILQGSGPVRRERSPAELSARLCGWKCPVYGRRGERVKAARTSMLIGAPLRVRGRRISWFPRPCVRPSRQAAC